MAVFPDPTERFSDRAADYSRYRPGYPAGIIPFLAGNAGLKPDSTVADIGSGTGLLTALFLAYGCTVFGVDPNRPMLEEAALFLKPWTHYIPVQARAEQTTLADGCADLIVAGQAFHWFDRGKTKVEFSRIAREGAYTALIWNERRQQGEFLEAYDQLIRKYATDYATVNHQNIRPEDLADFFAPAKMESRRFDNAQDLDREGLKGRLLSSSYMPARDHPDRAPMWEDLDALFDRFASDGKVRIEYDTLIYYGMIG